MQRRLRAAGATKPKLLAWRGQRRAILARLADDAPMPAMDRPVYLVGLRGRVAYRRARHPPGTSAIARGRFAYATYDVRGGALLDFGVLKRVPDL